MFNRLVKYFLEKYIAAFDAVAIVAVNLVVVLGGVRDFVVLCDMGRVIVLV